MQASCIQKRALLPPQTVKEEAARGTATGVAVHLCNSCSAGPRAPLTPLSSPAPPSRPLPPLQARSLRHCFRAPRQAAQPPSCQQGRCLGRSPGRRRPRRRLWLCHRRSLQGGSRGRWRLRQQNVGAQCKLQGATERIFLEISKTPCPRHMLVRWQLHLGTQARGGHRTCHLLPGCIPAGVGGGVAHYEPRHVGLLAAEPGAWLPAPPALTRPERPMQCEGRGEGDVARRAPAPRTCAPWPPAPPPGSSLGCLWPLPQRAA